MADRRHRFPCIEEGLCECDSLGLHPQFVRVDDAAGQQQRVEVVWTGSVERYVHWKVVTPIQ
jgi:hypothetical protein